MGTYFRVTAGPVLVCKYHYEEIVTEKPVTNKLTTCKNQSCSGLNKPIKTNAKFCPECGSPVTTEETTGIKQSRKREKSVPCIFDLMDQGGFREDRFCDIWGGLNNEKLIEDTDILVASDLDEIVGRECRFEARDFAIIARNPNQAEEIAKAETALAPEIAYLKTKYDSVHVEWMIATDGS